MPLTVLAVADEVSPLLYDHFDERRWSGIDCIISCGDLPPEYLDFLGTKLSVPVFYVRGNHDGAYPRSTFNVGQDLHGRIVEYKGVRIAGFEGCRRYNHGLCQYTESQMRRAVRRARLQALWRGTPDLVVTHAPPSGFHDAEDPCHRGFDCFRQFIDVWKPSFLIHGHTHAYNGKQSVAVVSDTKIVNVFPYCTLEVGTEVLELEPTPSTATEVRTSSVVRGTHTHA
ncbi:MAG TPA: metallophosphoesterase [Chloroflexota bacterium]